MAREKKPRTRRAKPFIAAALFCDKMLERVDGAMSAINVIDTYTAFVSRDALTHHQRVPVSLKVFLAFKSGGVVGDCILKLVLRIPTGKRKAILEKPLPFKGGEQGVNVKVNFDLQIKTQGLYWMDVVVDGARLTRMPLKILFQEIDQISPHRQP